MIEISSNKVLFNKISTVTSDNANNNLATALLLITSAINSGGGGGDDCTETLNYSGSNSSCSINATSIGTNEIIDFQLTNDIILQALILSLIVLTTVFGNTLVLLAIFCDFHLRSPTHYLMGSLALADLMLGLCVCVK